MHRAVIMFVAALSSMLGCSSSPDSPILDYELPPTWQATDRIRYWVEGGGNIDFTIEDASDSFTVVVSQHEHETIDEVISVSKVDADSADVSLLASVFEGAINIGGTIYRAEAPTGTWTYLYIEHNDDWLRIANNAIICELRSFGQFVRAHLDPASSRSLSGRGH
jgi:hypothetical protein